MNLKQLPYWIIGVLIGVILLMRACAPSPEPPKPSVVKTTDTVYVYKIIHDTVYIPGVVKYIPAKSVPIVVDTPAILKDYYAKRFYYDSIKIGDIGHVYVKDTISQNRIIHRQSWGDYTIPVVTNTTTITLPPDYKNQVYIGFQIAGPYLTFGPQIVLKTKTDQLYQVGAGLSQSGLQYNLGIGWKIKLK